VSSHIRSYMWYRVRVSITLLFLRAFVTYYEFLKGVKKWAHDMYVTCVHHNLLSYFMNTDKSGSEILPNISLAKLILRYWTSITRDWIKICKLELHNMLIRTRVIRNAYRIWVGKYIDIRPLWWTRNRLKRNVRKSDGKIWNGFIWLKAEADGWCPRTQ
jgi:hypothetical protein